VPKPHGQAYGPKNVLICEPFHPPSRSGRRRCAEALETRKRRDSTSSDAIFSCNALADVLLNVLANALD